VTEGQFQTWSTLATIGGAAAITYLIVAYTRRLVDKTAVGRAIGTDLYAALVGAFILFLALVAVAIEQATPLTGTWWLLTIPLAILNGFMVASAAGKMHDKAIDEHERQFLTTDAGKGD